MDFEVGTRIGDRYVVLGDVGAGGMGVVLRARDERLGRLVAVKVLPPDAIGDDASRKRLVREARGAAALEHQSIVHVYDVGEMPDGGAFLVMELVKGRSLGEHLRNGTLTVTQRVGALIDVAHALHYAHDQGFVHRDIKPDNIMVRDDGRVVVLDFGLVKSIAPGLGTTVEASLVSSKSAFVGTPAYVSPEQARGETLDAKTDQFSLAVSLFEMITGELPWDGGTPLEVISHILRGEPKKLCDVAPSAPGALGAALLRALDKNAADRFPTIGDFADAVALAMPEASAAPSLRDIGIGPVQSMATAQLRTLSAPGTSRPISPRSRALRAWHVIGLAGALALGSSTAFFAFRHTTPPVQPFVLARTSTVACPLLRATDPDLPFTGWLGAAAATLVCERVQMVLGGSPDRTRIPAELLGLPHQPVEGFPTAPFDAPDAIDKSTAQAKSADAFIDGAVDHAADFHVTLALKAPKGDVLEQGDGHGATLITAVRAAMVPIVTRLLPATDVAYAQRWFEGASSEGRLDLFDLHVVVIAEDTPSIRAACAALRPETLGKLAPFARALCAEKLYQTLPEVPPLDASNVGALLETASALRFFPNATPRDRDAQIARVTKLREAAASETGDLAARALLLACEAEIDYQLADNRAAASAARSSIQASPKISDVRGNAWHRQSFVSSQFDASVLAGHAAWVPWEPYAWANLLRALDPKSTQGYQRAYVLAQHGYWAVEYGVRLTELNRIDEARGVAAATHDTRLDLLLMHAERRPGAALTMGAAALRALAATPESGNTATRLAANVVDLDALLGKPIDDAITDYVERFIMPDPPMLTKGVTTFFGTIAVCTQLKGPLAKRCIERIASLFDHGFFAAVFISARDGIEGARCYVNGDYAGAAKAWRPVTKELLAEVLRAPMTTAFDRAGDMELADRVDDMPVAAGKTAPDVELCYARKAKRAEKRGDMETAHKLARTFVDRWDGADERPPMVAEMKRILLRSK